MSLRLNTEEKNVMQFSGHPTATLSNEYLRVDYLIDVGPRIARLFLADSDTNLLAELPDKFLDTAYGRFQFMGGHRLWHAPESLPRTYIPDQPVTVENIANGVRLTATVEPGSNITKTIEIRLSSDCPAATICHEIRNEGLWAIELAPWALTMFRLGGVGIFPQPVENRDTTGLLPNRRLVIWPYTNVRDERIRLNDDFIMLVAQPSLPPCKIGYFNPHGWIGYLLDGCLFVKRFEFTLDVTYPDEGCNIEAYCNDHFVELESLGPLTKIQPGESMIYTEIWELYPRLDLPFISDVLRQQIQELSNLDLGDKQNRGKAHT